MLKLKILVLLAFLILPATLAAQKKELIGYRHKGVVYGETLPNGARDLGGGLLSDDNYGVSRFAKGGKHMLWLEKVTSRDKKGVPSWEVRDVLVINNLKKKSGIFVFLRFALHRKRTGRFGFNRAGGISAREESL
ncbi:MAG TPA: hypothetical protein VEQ34_11500 [Pyrinomonadaceae bacterium]|nr:hypothetical protein [Pyrinomonadaceae bacterium]